jgi:hypothetical protein
MTRVLFLVGFAVLAAACGNKSFESLCATQLPVPAGCNTACSPGSATDCPAGYHCSADGKCDLVCTPGGNECGNDHVCTADGYCIDKGDNPPPIDTECPNVHVVAQRQTPTVELLLDQSGSMTADYGNTDRWNAMRDALVAPGTGVVGRLAASVVFGATLYSADSMEMGGRDVGIAPCPTLTSRPRALNNFTAIRQLLQTDPDNNTPTGESIDAVRMSFAQNPPMANSPPIILLATDGLPDTCADANPPAGARQEAVNALTVAAAQRAYQAGIKLFFLFVGNDEAGDHPQKMANAGAGLDINTGRAKFYVATNPADLAAAFEEIIGGVLSCDLRLNGTVDPNDAPTGIVTLNGQTLTFGTDWMLGADGVTLQILGNACTTLKSTPNATIDAEFSCGAVIF